MWHGQYYQPIDLELFVASYQSVFNRLTFFGRLSLQNALGANRDFSIKIWYFRRWAQRKFCFYFNERHEIESRCFDSVPRAFDERKCFGGWARRKPDVKVAALGHCFGK